MNNPLELLMNFKHFLCLALIFLVFAFCSSVHADTDTQQATVQKAIAAVYPALVRIDVVEADYDAGRSRKYEVAGSGVIISSDGYVITNHHVAGKATSLRCVLTNKQQLDAKLIGTDILTDIAVLKLDLSEAPELKGKLPFAHFTSSTSLAIGDPILAMGCPLALSQSVTQGIIANKEMIFSRRFSDAMVLDGEDVGLLVRWITHDAQILPGNSGGPLVNLQGEIVGINEINVGGLGGGGLGGAIPSELAESVARQIMEKGRVPRSWIGADFQPRLKGSHQKSGALIAGVVPDSPAERAGIKAGDIVLSLNGTPLDVEFREQLPPLNRLVFSAPLGSTIRMNVLRNGKENTISVVTIAREDAQGKEEESKEWGMVIEDLTGVEARESHLEGKKGVLVSSVRSGGPSDQASPSLEQGDLIETIADKPVANREAFFHITAEITKGQTVPVTTLVGFRRKSEELLTVIDVGIRQPPNPTAEARKAWLPVETQVLSRKLASSLQITGKTGVRITNVYPDTTAEKAGLHIGDVITQIDGQDIEASESQDTTVFETMVRAYRAGSKPQFTVIRNGKTMQIAAELAEQPKPERQLPVYQNIDLEFKARDLSYSDRIDRDLNPKESGALVTEVERSGWAGIGGLQEDDLIQTLNGSAVRGIDSLKPLLDAAAKQKDKYVVVLVKRGVRTLFLELQPVWPERGGL